MAIEPNLYLTTLENKVAQDKVFRLIEKNEDNPYKRFFTQNNIEIHGKAVKFLLTWPKEGIDFNPELSIHNKDSGFKRQVNIAYFNLPRIYDKVHYEILNEERFLEALDTPTVLKNFTDNLLQQTADNIEEQITERIPALICRDENFIKVDKEELGNKEIAKGNLYECEDDKFNDPIWILQQIFNGSSILRKTSDYFNKGWCDEEEENADNRWKPLTTKIASYKKMIVLLDSTVKNTITIGGYKENVNFQALDLEKRFGTENVLEDTLPDGYKILIFDERSFQLYRRGAKKGFSHGEEPENDNKWVFLKPVVHGGFIPAFNALAWKVKKED